MSGEGSKESLEHGQGAYAELSKLFDSFETTGETSFSVEKEDVLSDGVSIKLKRDNETGNTRVEFRDKLKGDLIQFSFGQNGIDYIHFWGVSIQVGSSSLINVGELRITPNKDASKTDNFRNNSKPVIEWFREVIAQDRYIQPTSLLSLSSRVPTA